MSFRRPCFCLAAVTLLVCSLAALAATEFTYQGKLTDSTGQPANGAFTMLFRLWDAATGGNQVGTTVTRTAVPVSSGLFKVDLDFGAAPFQQGLDRWLQVEVGSQILAPRTKITTVPMAVHAQTAQSVPWSGITDVPSGLQPGGAAGGDLTGTYPNPSLAASESSLAKVSGGAMTASGGKVGIGTAVPANLFEVAGQRGVRDQECNNTANIVSLTTHFVLAQSFTAGVSGVLSAIDIDIAEADYYATMVPATLTIRDGDGSTGTVLCAQTVEVLSGLTFRAFPLAAPVAVTAGNVYTFELNTGGADIVVRGSSDDTYTRGRLLHRGQPYDFLKDINFRSYVIGGASTGLVVQPSSLNVGIGTMWPAAPLDVAGRAKVGEFQLGTYSTAGYVLTADARGVGTWQSASAAMSGVSAGGDLTGKYPNPTIADGKVGNLALATDQESLKKVSGGVVASVNGQIGIGTSTPEDRLSVNGALRLDTGDQNGNTLGPGAIRFGSGATGEGIACNRSNGTAGENRWGLDFYTHNVRRMSINLDGNVGIGTTDPQYKLHVNGSVAGVGAYNQLSDERFKTNIEEIPSALDRVESLGGVTFDWKASEHPEIDFGGGRQAGVLAQEVRKVLPEAVTRTPDGTLSVSYSSLVPLLIEAIKEQQAQIDSLKSELEKVKARGR